MQISITEAESKLDELVDRAEAGEEVILASDGRPAVQLVPVEKKPERAPHFPGEEGVPER